MYWLDDTDEEDYTPTNREKKLIARKNQMKVNSAGLKKQVLPLLEKKAKEARDAKRFES